MRDTLTDEEAATLGRAVFNVVRSADAPVALVTIADYKRQLMVSDVFGEQHFCLDLGGTIKLDHGAKLEKS